MGRSVFAVNETGKPRADHHDGSGGNKKAAKFSDPP
jgi:hypothetical protein